MWGFSSSRFVKHAPPRQTRLLPEGLLSNFLCPVAPPGFSRLQYEGIIHSCVVNQGALTHTHGVLHHAAQYSKNRYYVSFSVCLEWSISFVVKFCVLISCTHVPRIMASKHRYQHASLSGICCIEILGGISFREMDLIEGFDLRFLCLPLILEGL